MLGFRPIGSAPISTLLKWTATQTVEFTFRYASRDFATRRTDTPANTFVEGRINGGLSIERRISPGEQDQFGPLIETTFGEIRLNNVDGWLGRLANDFFADGREIVVKRGFVEVDEHGWEDVQPFVDFQVVYRATAGDWYFEHDEVQLRVVDPFSRLRDRLQQQVYGGTGGSNGTPDMAGRTKPVAFGRCLNITGQVVDPLLSTIQLHAGPISDVIAVYDRGVELTFDTDYASYTDLAQATIAVEEYATCLAAGFIRVGALPTAVTADIDGALDNLTGNHIASHGSLLRTVLRDYGNFESSELDNASFTALTAANTGRIGLFLPAGDTSTVEEVLARIAASCGAVIGADGGLIRTFRLDAPLATAAWRFDARNVLSLERERGLGFGDGWVPWKAWGLSYARNWTVQTGSDLAESVSQSRRQFLEAEHRYVFTQDSDIAIRHRTSRGIIVDTLFIFDTTVGAPGAQEEAERRQALYGLGRAVYRAVVKDPAVRYAVRLGQTARLIYDRWDLHGGKNFVVVGVRDDADTGETTVLLFG